MKILILTGRFGMGHYSVARALSERITAEVPGAQCVVVDLLAEALGGTTGVLYKAYTLFIGRTYLQSGLPAFGKKRRDHRGSAPPALFAGAWPRTGVTEL